MLVFSTTSLKHQSLVTFTFDVSFFFFGLFFCVVERELTQSAGQFSFMLAIQSYR